MIGSFAPNHPAFQQCLINKLIAWHLANSRRLTLETLLAALLALLTELLCTRSLFWGEDCLNLLPGRFPDLLHLLALLLGQVQALWALPLLTSRFKLGALFWC
jgi:hypothetical protein